MHIVFGNENARILKEKYTVLELDTFRFGPGGPVESAFCVIEKISIMDMPRIDYLRTLHNTMLTEYRQQNWEACDHALAHLVGEWSKELDSFYTDVKSRVDQFKENPPGDSWDYIIEKPKLES